MEKLIRFLKEEDGLESVEYALLGVLIACGISAAVILARGWINTQFTAISNLGP
jgi:Flp pilus assembly pilin Flp